MCLNFIEFKWYDEEEKSSFLTGVINDMKFRTKVTMIVILFILVIVVSNQFTVVQHATARLTASTYVSFKYIDMDLSFDKVEYSPQFGDYSVSYKDNNGKRYSFMVTPKFMPVVILYDPLNPGP